MIRRAVSIAGVAILAAGPARAGPRRVPPVDLVYTRGRGAEACPAASALRRAVLKEMGYDPFTEEPSARDRRLRVSIERRRDELVVEMEMRDEAGDVAWTVTSLRSRSDCATLLEAVGLAIVLRIDPLAAGEAASTPADSTPSRPASPRRPAPSGAPPREAPKAAPPRATSAPPDPTPALLVGGGPLFALASPLSVAPGASLLLDLRWPLASVSLEARAVLPGAGGRQGRRIDTWSLVAVLAPCARFGRLAACGLLELGAAIPGGPEAPSRVRAFSVAGAGFRAAFDQRLSRRLLVRAHADLLGTFTHERTTLDSGFMWSAPEAVLVLGVELAVAPRGFLSNAGGVTSTPSTNEATP